MEEVKIVRRVALSSMPVQRAELLSVFEQLEQVTAKEASDILGIKYRTAKRHLDDLHSLGVLNRSRDEDELSLVTEPSDDEKKDTRPWIYSPHPRFLNLIRPPDALV